MERLEGKVLGPPGETVAFYVRVKAGERTVRRARTQVRFTLMLADGSHVRVGGRWPRIGPTETHRGPWRSLSERLPAEAAEADLEGEVELRERSVRVGDHVVVEGAVRWGKGADGYRGATKRVPEAIDAIAIGVGDEAGDFLDAEADRRRRAALLQRLRALTRIAPATRNPVRVLGLGLLLLIATVVLDLRDQAPVGRFFLATLGLHLGLGALLFVRLALGWTHQVPAAERRSAALGLFVVVGMLVLFMGLDVAGGAASHGRIGMATVPAMGGLYWWLTRTRSRGKPGDARGAHRFTLAMLAALSLVGAFYTVRNVAQDHYQWEAEVTQSDRRDVVVGDRCTIDVAYAPKGFASSSAQCQTEVVCGGERLYGDGPSFVRCTREADGFHGADFADWDGDGVVTLDGRSGHSRGVFFQATDR